MIPYGKQTISAEEAQIVADIVQSDWLTTGPKVTEFESALASFVGTSHAIAVANGTAALHLLMLAVGIGPGDEVIVPAISFVATSNAVIYCGGTPVFADLDPDTLLIDPVSVAEKITSKTKAIIAVDYAGQTCDYDAIRSVIQKSGQKIDLLSDACHAIGASDSKGRKAGSIADANCFSFHPVKPITTGEGGAVTTSNVEWAEKIKRLRGHGISSDFRQREKSGAWFYDMEELGFNYRITDFQCALGIEQLKRLPGFIDKRNQVAKRYEQAFKDSQAWTPLRTNSGNLHGYHLYVVKNNSEVTGKSRDEWFKILRDAGIGVNVHYRPIYEHSYYVKRLRNQKGICPISEKVFENILSLPIYPDLSENDQRNVLKVLLP